MNFRGRVFVRKPSVIKLRISTSGRGGRPAGRRTHRAEWHRLVLGALAAGGVGALSWVVLFPPAGVVPAVDNISSQALTAHASAAQHGQARGQAGGHASAPLSRSYSQPPRSYAPPSNQADGSHPAPTATGTTAAPTTTGQAQSTPTSAPTASPVPSPGTTVTVPPADSGSLPTDPPAAFPTSSDSLFTEPPPAFPTSS